MSIAEKLMTAEEFAALPDTDVRRELVRGRVVEMNSPQRMHCAVASEICGILRDYLKTNRIGRALSGDSGVRTTRSPDSVRGADVAYYSFQRAPLGNFRAVPYGDPCPEIVFEVLSSEDRWSDVVAKVCEYLDAGVVYVGVVEPGLRLVHLFTSGAKSIVLRAKDEISFPDLLPGFGCRVGDFFNECE